MAWTTVTPNSRDRILCRMSNLTYELWHHMKQFSRDTLALLSWYFKLKVSLPCMAQVGVVVHGGSAAVPVTTHTVYSCCAAINVTLHSLLRMLIHQYQVASPSLARMRGSFCLVRLLKAFKPVSKPLGFLHFFPVSLQQAPLDVNFTPLTDWAALKTPRRSFAFRNTDLPGYTHIVTPRYVWRSTRTAS